MVAQVSLAGMVASVKLVLLDTTTAIRSMHSSVMDNCCFAA